MIIKRITSDEYDVLDNVIFIPYNKRLIKYCVVVESEETLNIDFFKVSFLNSISGFKYKLTPLNVGRQGEITYLFYFGVDYQSGEKANIDFIDLTIFSTKVHNLKSRVKVVQLKNTNRSFNYLLNGQPIVDSNLLSLRTRIMSPSWGTINKNIVSNGSKMLDVLHNTFSSSYFKVNEFLRQTYSDYTPFSFSRLRITERPSTVLRETSDSQWVELKETDNIYSSVKEVRILEKEENIKLTTVVLEAYQSNTDELIELNLVLPTALYFKNDSSNDLAYVTCTVNGYDNFDNRITETILTRKDLYTKIQNNFTRIDSINTSNNNVEVSNFVDLRYNHFVINNNFIIPPIVDENYRTFKPLIRKLSNNEITENIITITNPILIGKDTDLKFSIDTKNNPLDSVYVTEDLDILYTYKRDNGTVLNYSKIGIDFSKNIYNNITLNNNSFISVSDINTNIGDWVDIKLNLVNWIEDSGDESFLIQIRNKDTLYYYNTETSTITTDKIINYYQTTSSNFIDFSIQVENDSPYIITVFSSNLKKKAACSTITNQIHPYSVETILSESSLILYKNNIYFYTNIENLTENVVLETEEDYLYVILKWEKYSTLDYLINFEDYFISNLETNINPLNYSYICKDNNYGMPVILKIDTNFLETDYLKIGVGFNINNSLIGTGTSCEVTFIKNNVKKTIQLNPKQIPDQVTRFEYKLNYKTMEEEVIDDY